MLWQKHGKDAPSSNTDLAIDAWLQERQEVLVLLNQVNHTQPFKEDYLETDEEVSKEFNLLLADYVSCGHMEIFEKMLEIINSVDSKINSNINNKNLRIIIETTNTISEFIDNNDSSSVEELSVCLAKRLDAEDVLINEYITARNKIKRPLKTFNN